MKISREVDPKLKDIYSLFGLREIEEREIEKREREEKLEISLVW